MPNSTYYEGQPLVIGNETQLLLDDLMIEDCFNLERVLHFPVKYDRNPILVRDQPWEGDIVTHLRVIWVEVLRHPLLGEHADYYFASKGDYSYRYEGFGLDDCAPMSGDGTAVKVRWKDRELGELINKPVYLRFELQNMDLYAFRVTQE